MAAALHEIAGLVDDARFADCHQMLGLVEGYLLFEFITRHAAMGRGTLYREVSFIVAYAHTHGLAARAADVSLFNARRRIRFTLVFVVTFMYEELSFYFQSAHFLYFLFLVLTL